MTPFAYLAALAESQAVIRAWSDYYRDIQPREMERQKVSLN